MFVSYFILPNIRSKETQCVFKVGTMMDMGIVNCCPYLATEPSHCLI